MGILPVSNTMTTTATMTDTTATTATTTTAQAQAYELAGEMTNACPAGYDTLLSKQECIDIAPSMCMRGFGDAKAYRHLPTGCFLHPYTPFAKCTVYFNTLTSSSPGAEPSVKICKRR